MFLNFHWYLLSGTVLEKFEEQKRKATEMKLFKELASITKAKNKETFMKVSLDLKLSIHVIDSLSSLSSHAIYAAVP